MGIKKGREFETTISDIAFGGKGIARIDGMAVFVDQTVPEDRVRVRITRKKPNYAEARVIEMEAPSPLRIEAPCRYSGVCGGCKWQYLPYEIQLEFKRRHVAESLAHIGRIDETEMDVPVHPVIPSENRFEYRNKMEFSCADRRWLMPEEMGREDLDTDFAIGLHVPGTYHKVLDIEACLIQPALGNRILGDAREYMKASALPAYGLRSHEGFWRFLMLRHAAAYDRWMVNIITAREEREAVQPLAHLLMERYPEIVSVVNNVTARKAGVAVGEYEVHLAGERVIRDRIGGLEFEISANSFFQTNTRSAERLYDVVKRYADLTGNETVLDLYCGTGTIGLYLADVAKQVTGMELVESAVADARRNRELNGIDNCRFIAGDIKDRLSPTDERPDILVIDPPRAGMHKEVVKRIIEMSPPRIVYVSCNPATLARDLAMLIESYRVVEVQPVDMFPHTYHVESVARLERR